MRVPPDQSFTASEQPASASSGSFMRSCRVTLVSRVPKTKLCTFRRSDSACRKCSISREYCVIEPEMSQMPTIGGRISARARKAGHDDVAADPQRLRAGCGAGRCGRARRASAGGSSGDRREATSAASARFACVDLGVRHLRKILALQDFARRDGQSRVDLDLGVLVLLTRFRPEAPRARASPPAFGFSVSAGRGGATGDSMAIIFSISPRCRQKSSNAAWKTARCSRFFTKTEWSVQ